jgi:hypothetical protein
MRLLEEQGFLGFRPVNESGGHASFTDVRTTAAGKRWLYTLATGADDH